MKYRKDITSFLRDKNERFHKNLFKIYEKNGLLYSARFLEDNKTIDYYSQYGFLWSEDNEILKKEIITKFNVIFNHSNIACKCGETNMFSATYGNYSLNLICNSCQHEFQAYSG